MSKMFQILVHAFAIVSYTIGAFAQENNVCGSFKDYYTMRTSNNCWYDVAASGTIRDVIQYNGYPFEEHKVTTIDGYILKMHRIPNTNHPKPKANPVYLQHGLLADGSCFIGLRNNSLAFVLSNAGYDVWIGNIRGTVHSEGHLSMNPKDKKFWDHGLDELSLIDIPAMINYIRDTTGRAGKVIYVGHSLGTTLGMIYGSGLPKEAAENVKLFLMMAPAHKLTNMISPLRNLVPFSSAILQFIQDYDLERLVSQGSQQKAFINMICRENPKVMQLCIQLSNQFYGPITEIGTESVPVIFNFLPAGGSIKVIKHISDFVRDKFQKYDYGVQNNQVYGQPSPPEYDVRNIKVPVYVMYTVKDWATTKEDATNFYYSLSKKSRFGLYEINVDFNHMDFLYGRYAKKLVYDQILNVFSRIKDQY